MKKYWILSVLVVLYFIYFTVDNSKTTIICNYGNKKIITAHETKLTFNRLDFLSDYLPDNKKMALQKICEITPSETREGFDAIYNDLPNRLPLFEVKPVYKWF